MAKSLELRNSEIEPVRKTVDELRKDIRRLFCEAQLDAVPLVVGRLTSIVGSGRDGDAIRAAKLLLSASVGPARPISASDALEGDLANMTPQERLEALRLAYRLEVEKMGPVDGGTFSAEPGQAQPTSSNSPIGSTNSAWEDA